jgi:hypothetical protein
MINNIKQNNSKVNLGINTHLQEIILIFCKILVKNTLILPHSNKIPV